MPLVSAIASHPSHSGPGQAAFGFTRLTQAGPAPSCPTYRCTSGSNSSPRLATIRPGLGARAAIAFVGTQHLTQDSSVRRSSNPSSGSRPLLVWTSMSSQVWLAGCRWSAVRLVLHGRHEVVTFSHSPQVRRHPFIDLVHPVDMAPALPSSSHLRLRQ
jgi:hypothetical protein